MLTGLHVASFMVMPATRQQCLVAGMAVTLNVFSVSLPFFTFKLQLVRRDSVLCKTVSVFLYSFLTVAGIMRNDLI